VESELASVLVVNSFSPPPCDPGRLFGDPSKVGSGLRIFRKRGWNMPEGDEYTRERNDGMSSGYPSDDKESVLPGFGREFVIKFGLSENWVRELTSLIQVSAFQRISLPDLPAHHRL
jgi:hypothetical protein